MCSNCRNERMQKIIQFALLTMHLACEATVYVTDNDITRHMEDNIELEMLDLLGLTEQTKRLTKEPSLRNSASKFLLEVYNEIQSEDHDYVAAAKRRRRSMRIDAEPNFITQLDRWEIENCNDIITFSSKPSIQAVKEKLALNFNTNDVPRELQLVHAVLRIYQDPDLGIYQHEPAKPVTITVYKRIYNRQQQAHEMRVLTSFNTTTQHKGWLELNVTHVLSNWLTHKTMQQVVHGHDIYLDVNLLGAKQRNVNALSIGLVPVLASPHSDLSDLQPFIIGYFNGPELLVKMQKLRFKRELIKRKRQAEYFPRPPAAVLDDYQVKPCERLNFTLEFRDLELHRTIIAPKKFEAFFCGGQCNFPLGSKMNATNHAIVQTLMHLKKPHLPKPCCVPTVLGSISILYYLNEDSVNLKKIPQSVAKECGCH